MIKMTEKEIKERINEIMKDERLFYPTADVFTNAPLAMIQLTLEVELYVYERVLGIGPTDVNELRKQKNNTLMN